MLEDVVLDTCVLVVVTLAEDPVVFVLLELVVGFAVKHSQALVILLWSSPQGPIHPGIGIDGMGNLV